MTEQSPEGVGHAQHPPDRAEVDNPPGGILMLALALLLVFLAVVFWAGDGLVKKQGEQLMHERVDALEDAGLREVRDREARLLQDYQKREDGGYEMPIEDAKKALLENPGAVETLPAVDAAGN